MGGRLVVLLLLGTKLVKHALDLIGRGFLRRRFVDDLQDGGLRRVEAENSSLPITDASQRRSQSQTISRTLELFATGAADNL
jgi:hypothetical protein